MLYRGLGRRRGYVVVITSVVVVERLVVQVVIGEAWRGTVNLLETAGVFIPGEDSVVTSSSCHR